MRTNPVLQRAVEPPIRENKEFWNGARANFQSDQVSGAVETGEMPSVAQFMSVENWGKEVRFT